MPIIVSGTAPTPTPGPPPPSYVNPEPSIDLIDADGVVWPLTAFPVTGMNLVGRPSGFGAPPVSLDLRALPGGGALVAAAVDQPGTLVIAVLIEGPTPAAYLSRVRAFRAALRPNRAGQPKPLTMRVSWPDGSRRLLDAYCTTGPERADATPDNDSSLWSMWTLQLLAPDPLWRDEVPQTLTFTPPVAAGILPFLPIALTTTSVLGAFTLNNPGDGPSYPVWTIVGPGTPTLVNNTTGITLALSQPVPLGRTVTVDTSVPLMVDDLGVNWFPYLAAGSDFWQIQPGPNSVNVALTGASTGSHISLSWTSRWCGA